jgi:peptide chain release factor subunit 1
MSLTESEKYHMKKFVKELESHSARHTEFVTVYVPTGYDLNKVMTQLSQEQGTATNIKSAQTRGNVIDALEKMIQHLKLFKRTPPNGLAVFSGNVASKEGKSDVKVWSIEPPIPLKTRIYRCEKNFQVDILKDMASATEVYGLVVIDSRDATIALLKGKAVVPILKTHSHVPGKFRAGGQSALRFARNREIAVKEHFKKVASLLKDQFLMMKELK